MLKTRILTGLVLIGFIFWSLFSIPSKGFVLVAGILSAAMMHEWMDLVSFKSRWGRILLLDLFIFFEFLVYWFMPVLGGMFWIASAFWIGVLPFLIYVQRSALIPKFNQPTILILGLFTLIMFFAGLVQLREAPQGEMLVLMAFLVVWLADSLAYVTGRLIGKHKLIPVVSPGKTWEGCLGAALMTLPLLLVYKLEVLSQTLPAWAWYFALFGAVIFSVVGDLFESLIKRSYKVKDSGTLLPGHGGLLDRFDSLMAVAPLMALLYLQGVL